MKLCFATNNQHKLHEVAAIVGRNFFIQSLADIGCTAELPETRDTLEGNALQKAEYVWEHFGVPCFADDTGLEVMSLGGEPGVYSARYAGPQRNSDDNMDLLLQKLGHSTAREARFRTIFALIGLTPSPLLFEGEIRGHITTERRGNAGFGYDPIFVPEGFTTTFAEMTLDQKNQLSHRARATRKLSDWLTEYLPR